MISVICVVQSVAISVLHTHYNAHELQRTQYEQRVNTCEQYFKTLPYSLCYSFFVCFELPVNQQYKVLDTLSDYFVNDAMNCLFLLFYIAFII